MTINSIAYLSNTGGITGGGERSLLDLLAGLDKEKFNPLLICPEEGEVAAAARKLGVAVEIVGMKSLRIPDPFSFFRSVRRLAGIFKKRGIALVHANGSRCAVYGAAACRVTKLPLIWHVRILESDGLLDRFLAASSSRVIVNSNAVKGRFGWMRDKSKLEVIHNGIDLGGFYPSGRAEKIRKEFGFGPEAKVVATVGRLDWYKAHEYFLRAAGIVKAAVPEARFLVVGDGPRRRFLENLAAELGLGGCLRLTGDRPDIAEILNGIDLFALSSVSEGFGRVVVEAMACGKPVVATRVGGIVEIVEDGVTGILVPPRDPGAMARAIMELLGNSGKAGGMGAAGRGRAEKMFGIEKNVRKTEDLYEKVAHEK
jgi:glycosyltransferase involved in cell wall biosynthesis